MYPEILTLVYLPQPPCVPRRLLVYSGDWCLCRVLFGARSRGQGASTTWQSLAKSLTPALLGHAGAIQAIRNPPPPVPVPSPIFILIPYLHGRRQWFVALEVWFTRACSSHGRC